MIKDLKTVKKHKKGRLTIKDLDLIQTAYFQKLTKMNYIKMVGFQSLSFALVGLIVFQNLYAVLIGAAMGIWFGLFIHLPKSIKKNYFLRSYVERNRFINNFTQLIVNENLPLLDIIEKIIKRLEGELYTDMTILLARITSADSTIARSAFSDLANKYEEDVVFAQYIEQIETVFIEGTRNVNTFKELKTQHNIYFEKINDFQKDKEQLGGEFIFTIGLVFLITIIFSLGLGLDNYQTLFVGSPIGLTCCFLFSIHLFYQYFKSMKYIYDDSISTF